MKFDTYQHEARKTAIYLNNIQQEFPELDEKITNMLEMSYLSLGLGETGEVQNKIKKIIRDDNGIISNEKKQDVLKELGDVLWYVANMCSFFNVDMSSVAEQNIKKLQSRQQRGKLQGDGDER